MTFHPDMQFGDDNSATAGYLHPDHPFATAEPTPEFLAKLIEFVRRASISAREFGLGACAGIHTCEFCGRAHGNLNFGVPVGERVIFSPEMIGHYVEVHQYSPPTEFISAVMASPLPGTREYVAAIAPWIAKQRSAANLDDVSITLQRHVALVLFEFLSRFSKDQTFQKLDRADQVAVWTVTADLEAILVEPFDPQYEKLLKKARQLVVNYGQEEPGITD